MAQAIASPRASRREKRLLLRRLLEQRRLAARSYPLSFAQERLWFLDQLNPGSTGYTIQRVLRFDGELDLEPAELARALRRVLERHEVLRSIFSVRDGAPAQRVLPMREVVVALPYFDLSALSAEEQGREIRRLTLRLEGLPFDLGAGPLLRCSLVRLEHGRAAIVLSLHHVVADDHSVKLILDELGELYRAAVGGRNRGYRASGSSTGSSPQSSGGG